MDEFLEIAGLAVFVLVCTFILAICFTASGKLVRSKCDFKSLKPHELACLVLGFTGLGCMVYGFFEPYDMEVTTVSIPSGKLTASGGTVRVVHITDLHCDGIQRNEDRLPEMIRNLHPDLIVFTGDAANNDAGLKRFQQCITEIAKIAPTYASYGNHDTYISHDDIYRDTKVKRLEGGAAVSMVKGNMIWVGGIGVREPDANVAALLRTAPPDSFTIFLYHYPNGVIPAARQNIDLVCAGHTHGGQIRLPLYGAIVTNSSLAKKYEWGLYKRDNTWLNVSKGIGMTALPVRFLAKPEISVIDIVPGSSAAPASQ
jgi:uncharacterized protein